MPTSGAERLHTLHTDHLNTPRLATAPTGAVVWRWNGNAFGDTAPTGTATLNLRFPGQLYDAESGLHYNWNRYYDPKMGRYVTSDPIGLAGGLNTYVYVGGNPLRWTDPTGESATVILEWCAANPRACGGAAVGAISTTGAAVLVGVGVLLYPSALCENEEEMRCKYIKDQCIQGCSDFVLQKSPGRRGDLGGMDFHFCVRRCMDDNGC